MVSMLGVLVIAPRGVVMDNRASNKNRGDSWYNYSCRRCGDLSSPYSSRCYCETRTRKCCRCKEPITPFNTKPLLDLSSQVVYHYHCLSRYKLMECECGDYISPFGIRSHGNCGVEVETCAWCDLRLTPYSPSDNFTWDGIRSFCCSECYNEYHR